MDEITVVIVDDSPFSIALLKDMLTESNFKVVGEARSLEETIKVVKSMKPDIVTMDVTMPGADGFECTREIHKIDSNIKVIMISSMMDEEIVNKAKQNHASGYIQKPVDKEELTLTINRIMADVDLYSELDSMYYLAFKESFINTFSKFTKLTPEFSYTLPNEERESKGISIIMGVIGKYSGKILCDVSYDTATKLTTNMLKRKPENAQEMFNIISELANIVSGNACSMLNKKNKLFGLRVSPPAVFHGNSLIISKSQLDTITCSIVSTEFGDIYMSVGFQRRPIKWM
ncbi:MAG: response regulator [Clostridium sp.]|nr:response regulator [Clostridium sp.]